MDIANVPFPQVGDGVALAVWLVVGIVIPFVVDLVTDKLADARVKSAVFLALQLAVTILSGFLVKRDGGEVFDWTGALWSGLITFVISNGVFKWGKRADITGSDGIINAVKPSGIGKHRAVDGPLETK